MNLTTNKNDTTPHRYDQTLLTIKDVATRLSLSPRTVDRLAESGLLTKLRIGGSVRFDPFELAELVESATRAQTAGARHALRDAQIEQTEGQ